MDTSTSTAPIEADRPSAGAPFAPLDTPRLILRPWQRADAPVLHRLINDWEIIRNLSIVPYPYGRGLADEWIDATERGFADASAWQLAITRRDNGALLGGAGVRLDTGRRVGLLGYWVGHKYWGSGFATEAARRLAHWALAHLDLEQLEATVAVDNPGSMSVLRRLGFRSLGGGSEQFLARGTACRIERFVATRDDLFGVTAIEPVAAAPAGSTPMLLVAACALIDADGRVLLARRPEGKKLAGLWEFPGGKVEPHETPEQAVIRELKEELGVDISATCLAPFAFASHAYDTFHLLMPLFLCRRWSGVPRGAEGQALAWVRPARLADYPMPPADKPLIPLLRDFL
jgi:8-oxo-dGTP diphosphatase